MLFRPKRTRTLADQYLVDSSRLSLMYTAGDRGNPFRYLLLHTLNMKEKLQIYNPPAVPQGKNLFDEDNYPQTEYKQPASLKPVARDARQRLRTAVVKRFLQEDYAVKKHNHTRDYTIDMCMYL